MFEKTSLKRILIISFLIAASVWMLQSCSQKSNSWTSKTYHNTTSHYNHYFIARETLKEAEEKFYKQEKFDYTQVLEVYPKLDQATSVTMTGAMEEVIKKASVNAAWHKNSKWLDDSYNLIGKARFYKLDYANSIETYKYVNSKGEDVNAKHTAMIGMLRVFTIQKDDYYAGAVIDFLENKDLDKVNNREYYLSKAHFYRQKREWEPTAESLEKAVKSVKRGEKRAKIYYMLGQLYQEMNNDSAAYANYRFCLKNNPNFEMTFYASLNKNSVFTAKNAEDEAKIMKYYNKLLKDTKNKDYKDKIYYEMAKFVWKRNRTNETLDYLTKSVRASTNNNYQKGASYLMTANIYYENLKKFRPAKAYYDSTLALMNKSNPDYYKYKNRAEILTELVKQLDIIQQEDSLQNLAKMSQSELDAVFSKMIEKEETLAKEKAKKDKEKKDLEEAKVAANPTSIFTDPNANQGGWYFYNQSNMVAGRNAFVKKWGNRPLTDFWRISAKQEDFKNEDVAKEPEEESPDKEPKSKNSKEDAEKAKTEQLKARKDQFISGIPKTQAQLDSSNVYIRRAMFKVGNIYNLELIEPDNAIPVFEGALERYPMHEKRLEMWYSLYLIFKGKNNAEKVEKYKNLILGNYPSSIYAKLIQNPNYLQENRELNEKAETAYKLAYEDYKLLNYESCVNQLDQIKINYPDNNINDKIDYLKAQMIGKTQNAVKYKEALLAFNEKYKTSPLVPIAKSQIEKCDAYIANFIKAEYLQTDSTKKYPYNDNLDTINFVVIAFYKRQNAPIEDIYNKFIVYNSESKATEEYIAEMGEIGSEFNIVIVRDFIKKADALKYYNLKSKKNFPIDYFKDFNHKIFIITEQNLGILQNLNDMEGYLEFFNQKYLK